MEDNTSETSWTTLRGCNMNSPGLQQDLILTFVQSDKTLGLKITKFLGSWTDNDSFIIMFVK